MLHNVLTPTGPSGNTTPSPNLSAYGHPTRPRCRKEEKSARVDGVLRTPAVLPIRRAEDYTRPDGYHKPPTQRVGGSLRMELSTLCPLHVFDVLYTFFGAEMNHTASCCPTALAAQSHKQEAPPS